MVIMKNLSRVLFTIFKTKKNCLCYSSLRNENSALRNLSLRFNLKDLTLSFNHSRTLKMQSSNGGVCVKS
jgi:hypothetical protein